MFRKLVLPFVLIVALVAPPLTVAAAPDRPRLLESVRALAWPAEQLVQDEDGNITVVEGGPISNHCTVTSINKKKHYWLTAAHCVTDNWPVGDVVDRKYFIGDTARMDPAKIVAVDVPDDLAILEAGSGVRALKLQDHDVEWRQKIKVAGHPLGWPEPTIFEGLIANPETLFTEADKPYMIYQIAGAPGNSGSAVVNNHDEIVSVLQIGWSAGTFGSVAGGAPWSRLVRFAQAYFG